MEETVSITDVIGAVKKSNPKTDKKLLKKAYEFALKAHEAKTKDPRIQHVLSVAKTVAGLGVDDATIAGAILHDVILKEGIKKEDIEKEFGEEIAKIVEECAHVFAIDEKNRNRLSPEMLSTVMLGAVKDIRALFIVAASAKDSLEREGILSETEMPAFAQTSLDVIVPLCDKLGLQKFKIELEDTCFKVLEPKAFEEIKSLVKEKQEDREKEAEKTAFEIEELLKKEKIKASVKGRAKHYFSIRKKMKSGKKFPEITDLTGARIICDTIKQCYEILGIIHSNYKIMPEEFDDYIANPKKNNYRSIHTVILKNEKPIEIQIRTWEMHWDNEAGLSAHWAYKEYRPDKYFDQKLSWAQEIVSWMQSKEKAKKFIESLKIEFGENKIFVLTPKREVIVLPEGATALDFAFGVHSELGFKCHRAKVNGKKVPLDHKLENSDIVEIITSNIVKPKREWLGFVKSDKAKNKIRQKLGITIIGKKPKPKKPQITTANMQVRMANCCNPLPGDEITGFRTTKRKITVHKTNCKNIENMAKEKQVKLDWEIGSGKEFIINLRIRARGSPSLLPKLLNAISDAKAAIVSTSAKSEKNNIVGALFKIRIKKTAQMDKIIKTMEKIPQVLEVERI